MDQNKEEMVKSMEHLHRFEDSDYDGFAGAESEDPLINYNIVLIDGERKFKNCILIIDGLRVEIYYYPFMDDPDDEVIKSREEQIFWKEFDSIEPIKLFISHEAKNLEGEGGLSVDVLKSLYGFEAY